MVSGPPGHRPVGVDYIAHKTGYSWLAENFDL